ncbi:MAG: tripartite tricarboxylate transporter TctB family protein [Sphaerochaetaceae bacterium]|nr:tripartite tricarboxylate transporter TctB family protein [Sphaerochaetaceae bacterium]
MGKGFKEVYTGLVLLIFSVLMYFVIIPMNIKSYAVYGLPPSFFPKVISAALALFSLLLLISGVREGGKELFGKEAISKHLRSINKKTVKNIAMIFGLFILYLIGLGTIGFLISTPIIIFLLGLAFRWKRYIILTILALVATAVLYVIFGIVLGSPLP